MKHDAKKGDDYIDLKGFDMFLQFDNRFVLVKMSQCRFSYKETNKDYKYVETP